MAPAEFLLQQFGKRADGINLSVSQEVGTAGLAVVKRQHGGFYQSVT